MTTYDENGGTRTGPRDVPQRECRGVPGRRRPDVPRRRGALAALKLYYHHSFHYERIEALHEAMLARGMESPYADHMADWKPDPEHAARITTRVECARYFPVRDRALIAHATQIDPEGPWFSVPLEVHQRAWPTEDPTSWPKLRAPGHPRG